MKYTKKYRVAEYKDGFQIEFQVLPTWFHGEGWYPSSYILYKNAEEAKRVLDETLKREVIYPIIHWESN